MKSNIGISPNYIKDWSIEEAIREIVQNMIDTEKEYGCDTYVRYYKDSGQAVVKDYGPGLKLRHLVMGISEKSEDAVGQFGEGLKLALLVFARDGRKIEIKSGDKKVTPEISYSEEFETDLISLNIDEMADHMKEKHVGTTIRFDCSKSELQAGKNYFFKFAVRDFEDYEKVSSQIFKPGGMVFVNDSLVGKVEDMEFSYRFGSERKDLVNRDRATVGDDEIHEAWKKLVQKAPKSFVKKLINMVKNGVDNWEVDSGIWWHELDFSYRDKWRTTVNEVFGDTVLYEDEKTANLAKYKGYESARIKSFKWRDLFESCGIKTTEDIAKKIATKKDRVLRSDLKEDEKRILDTAKDLIVNEYLECDVRIEVFESFAEIDDVFATYERGDDIISVKRSVLRNLQLTVDIILHEAVHKKTGLDDCTSEFADELSKLAAKLMVKQYAMS